MDLNDRSFSETCICGRTFSRHNAYNYHWHGCKNRKKCLSEALVKVKELQINKIKRRRIDGSGQGQKQLPPMGERSLDIAEHSGRKICKWHLGFFILGWTWSVGPGNVQPSWPWSRLCSVARNSFRSFRGMFLALEAHLYWVSFAAQ